jgi:predicted metal-dependent hydrolase
MEPEIKIRHQHRRSLMMRAVRGGLEVYVPLWLDKDDPQVRRFIQKGVAELADKVPSTPPEQSSRKALRKLVRVWAERVGVDPGKISFRAMQRKWGSCSSRDNITLNSSLTWLPPLLAE